MEAHIKRIKERVAKKNATIETWQECKFQTKFLLFVRTVARPKRRVYLESYFYPEELNHWMFQEYDWENIPEGTPQQIQEALSLCKQTEAKLNELMGIR